MMIPATSHRLLVVAIALAASLFGCAMVDGDYYTPSDPVADVDESSMPFYATGPVAIVDGVELDGAEFNELVDQRMQFMKNMNMKVHRMTPQMVSDFKERSLKFVVERHLMQRELEGNGIEVTDAEIDEAYVELKRRFGDRESLRVRLEQKGISDDDLRLQLEVNLRIEKYLATIYDLEVGTDEIRDFFEANRRTFATQEKAEARQIIIKVAPDADEATESEARKRAQKIYDKIAGGAEFDAVARTHSEGPTAQRGGDLGTFSRQQMVPAFSDLVFDELEVGEISKPLRTQFGYHIVHKIDHHEASEDELEDARDDIERSLRNQKRKEAYSSFISERKQYAEIEYLKENIELNIDEHPPNRPESFPDRIELNNDDFPPEEAPDNR